MTGSSDFSVQARILPNIEQAGLSELINFEIPLLTGPPWRARFNPAQREAIETVVPTFLCPSDPGDEAVEHMTYQGADDGPGNTPAKQPKRCADDLAPPVFGYAAATWCHGR